MKLSPFKFSSRRQLIAIVFPASCIGCDAELEQAAFAETSIETTSSAINSTDHFQRWQLAHWCESCWPNLAVNSGIRCRRCGAILSRPNPLDDQCAHCYGHELRFNHAFAVGNYQGLLQQLVIQMKNQHDESLAIQLGTLLGYELLGHGWTDFDQIVPVPTHWTRKLKRGFQASDVLAEAVSHLTDVPKNSRLVRTIRTTKKQGTLSHTGRLANVRNAFEMRSRANVAGQRILLVDDVMTSGATTSELTRVLKKAGAQDVCVAVVARGAGVS